MRVEGNLNVLDNKALGLGIQNEQVDWNEKSAFSHFYDAALNIVNETNMYQLQADQAQLDFVTGKNDNMLSVMLAQEKAYASLNFTVQVSNKVIEAYREIMRIQL